MNYKTMLCGTMVATLTTTTLLNNVLADDWKANAISPVANPLYFEDPRIRSEIRPIFMEHTLDHNFAGGGDVQVMAVQARWAVNDRLAIIATKDGYILLNAKGITHHTGFADIAAGVKYALIDAPEHQFILTPGYKINLPTGNSRVFQGSGYSDAFVAAEKGFDDFHLTANLGGVIAHDQNNCNNEIHYSAQVDYRFCKLFVPFATANAYTVVSEAKHNPGLTTEGYDLINFGSGKASGRTMASVGLGFRSMLTQNVDFGFSYEKAVSSPRGLFDDRYTVDFIIHF